MQSGWKNSKSKKIRSIDRSVGRSVDRSVTRDTHSADRRFLRGHEYATKNMHTRGNTRFERAIAQIFDFDRSHRLKFLLLWIFANIFLSSEPGGHVRFHESVRKERRRNGKRRRIFPRLAVTNESRDIEKLFVPREKTISISRLL